MMQRKTDIMEVSNDNYSRAYRATVEVTEYCPYKRNYAHGGKEWLESAGAKREINLRGKWITANDGSWPEMAHGWRWIMARVGSGPEMNHWWR